MQRARVLCFFVSIFICIAGCQTPKTVGFIDKQEYKSTRLALKKGQVRKALKSYPAPDQDYFIPTLEYSWISLLNGTSDTERLVRMSQVIEDSKMVRFSTEADRFFFKELDEHYVPAEHEVIMFHIITGLAFAQKGLIKKARIEAKRAAYYLPGPFISSSDFDDPGIRVLLASLWLTVDEWQQARPNLLKASKLSSSVSIIHPLKG